MRKRLTVHSDPRGAWHVQPEGEERDLSAHGNETDAERAAAEHAVETGAEEILVQDRYNRVHRSRLRPPQTDPE